MLKRPVKPAWNKCVWINYISSVILAFDDQEVRAHKVTWLLFILCSSCWVLSSCWVTTSLKHPKLMKNISRRQLQWMMVHMKDDFCWKWLLIKAELKQPQWKIAAMDNKCRSQTEANNHCSALACFRFTVHWKHHTNEFSHRSSSYSSLSSFRILWIIKYILM